MSLEASRRDLAFASAHLSNLSFKKSEAAGGCTSNGVHDVRCRLAHEREHEQDISLRRCTFRKRGAHLKQLAPTRRSPATPKLIRRSTIGAASLRRRGLILEKKRESPSIIPHITLKENPLGGSFLQKTICASSLPFLLCLLRCLSLLPVFCELKLTSVMSTRLRTKI